jgi:rhodanese-related sulfurtransferase
MNAVPIINQTVVDVRTPAEYMGGHVPGSINIPLQDLLTRIDEVRTLQQPIVLCCASGMRSLAATNILRSEGIACKNGGSWLSIHHN